MDDPSRSGATPQVSAEHAHLKETRLEGEDVWRGQLLHIRRDRVLTPDGTRSTREFVRHPGAVMVIPLLDAGPDGLRVVLERQYRYPIQRVVIEFPAGKRDPGEDLLACAQRELREETGYEADEWAHAGVLHPLVAYSDEFIDIWFARGLRAGERQLDPGETLDVFSASPDELLRWCQQGLVTDGKTLVGSLWLQNVLAGTWALHWQVAPTQGPAG